MRAVGVLALGLLAGLSWGVAPGAVVPWDRFEHTDIVATTFWVGEVFDASSPDGSQVCSTYDAVWAFHWSGVDAGRVPDDAAGCAGAILGGCDGVRGPGGACGTEPRVAANGFFPSDAGILPRENPFYLDVPFDDLNDPLGFAMRCAVVPWAHEVPVERCADRSFSYMKDRWVRILGPNGRTCYGQVEDAGPSHGGMYHDAAYVFGPTDARPSQQRWNNAGMDVSPALNGCLGFTELEGVNDRVSWSFVDANDVPPGPWRLVVTTSGVTR